MLASELVGPSGQVVAFELLPVNLAFLKRHRRLNHVANVRLFEAAVADEPGTALFAVSAHPSMGSLSAAGTLPVRVVTLDGVLRQNQIRPPQVIKIDVEGAEAAVLRGAVETLRRHRPRVLLAGHGTAQQQQCAALLADEGYELVVQRDGTADGMYESLAFSRADRDVVRPGATSTAGTETQ